MKVSFPIASVLLFTIISGGALADSASLDSNRLGTQPLPPEFGPLPPEFGQQDIQQNKHQDLPPGHVEATLKLVTEFNTPSRAKKLAEKHGFEIFDDTKSPAKYRIFFIRGLEKALEGLKSEDGVEFVEKDEPLTYEGISYTQSGNFAWPSVSTDAYNSQGELAFFMNLNILNGANEVNGGNPWTVPGGNIAGVYVIDSGVSDEFIYPTTNYQRFYNGPRPVGGAGQAAYRVDSCNHGTAVAGIIGQHDIIMGLAKDTGNSPQIIPIKADSTSSDPNICNPINSTTALNAISKIVDSGHFPTPIINMSLGTNDPNAPLYSRSDFKTAASYARSKGAIVVVASGNEGSYAAASANDNVLVVGAGYGWGGSGNIWYPYQYNYPGNFFANSYSNYGPAIDIIGVAPSNMSTEVFSRGCTTYGPYGQCSSQTLFSYTQPQDAFWSSLTQSVQRAKPGTSFSAPWISAILAEMVRVGPNMAGQSVAKRKAYADALVATLKRYTHTNGAPWIIDGKAHGNGIVMPYAAVKHARTDICTQISVPCP
jgi:subtilisin family serine protease